MNKEDIRIQIMETFPCPQCGEKLDTNEECGYEYTRRVYFCSKCRWHIYDSWIFHCETKSDIIKRLLKMYNESLDGINKEIEKDEKDRDRLVLIMNNLSR